MRTYLFWGIIAVILLLIVSFLLFYFVLPKVASGITAFTKDLVRESIEEAISSPQLKVELRKLILKLLPEWKDILDKLLSLLS